ncbi:ATP-binding cassette domain-containing protein [Flavitalea sp.]|nr:ATP-binding cassette domain-containing protein [Flavitalea sp.]
MIELNKVCLRLGSELLLDDVSLTIDKGQTLAITGASGSGKTSLAKVITGDLFHSGTVKFKGFGDPVHVEFISQEHNFKNLSNTSDFYYQQRFNASESDQSLRVSDLLTSDNKWIDLLHLRELLDRAILQLSNGENKRLQLAQKLQAKPDVLILDNPFLGLDVSGRVILENILCVLKDQGVQIILISGPAALSSLVTHVAVLEKGRLIFYGLRQHFLDDHASHLHSDSAIDQGLLRSLKPAEATNFAYAVRMINVHIQYGDKIVLDKLNWEIRRGECWSLSGPNGAGKSTLLSLITGDNPQAYANEIYLFDRRRGTGESIWDIKRNIGYVSPELHLFFDQAASCWEILASGFFDTIGLFRLLNDEQKSAVKTWLKILNLNDCEDKSLRSMSRGQQRLALLGRALIKAPQMLVLDEPCQGLDEDQTAAFIALVNSICIGFGTSLIYVSHYVQDVPSVITKYLRLDDGKTVKEL